MDAFLITESTNSCRKGRITVAGISIVTILILVVAVVFIPQFLRLKEGISKIACYNMQKKLAESIRAYNEENTKTVKLKDNGINQSLLIETKYLFYKLECPAGGWLHFDKFNSVACEKHSERYKETLHPDILENQDRRKGP